jgi:hypothetical protein
MTMDAPRFRPWWNGIGENCAVRANIGVDGKVYGKYGTQFDTRLLVIDKVAPTGEQPVLADVQTVDDTELPVLGCLAYSVENSELSRFRCGHWREEPVSHLRAPPG